VFLKCSNRKKDGKEHRSWSVVESRRYADGKVAQRHVLYLGEINDRQRRAWERAITVFDESTGTQRAKATGTRSAMPPNGAPPSQAQAFSLAAARTVLPSRQQQ
jgi:hypothetical protein